MLGTLEVAGRAGLVEESGPDRYHFAHALVRSALREDLSRSRRVRIHLRIAEALESVRAGAADDHADALAYHFSEAAPIGGVDKAFHYTLAAAERASRMLAHADAAAAYGRALEFLDQTKDHGPLTRCELLLARGEAQTKGGEFQSALATSRVAAEEAAARSAPEHQARAALAFEDANWQPGLFGGVSVTLLRSAEAMLPSGASVLRARILAGLSRALHYSGRRDEAIAVSEEAVAMARRLDDAATLAHVLYVTNLIYIEVPYASILLDRSREELALAMELGDDDAWLKALVQLLMPHMMLGDIVAFDELVPQVARLLEDSRQPWFRFWMVTARLGRAFLAGDLDRTERMLGEVRAVGREVDLDEEGVYGVGMFLLRREQGRLGEVAPALRLLVRLDPEARRWQPGLAALYAEMGMLDEARTVFDRLAADGFAGLPRDSTRLLSAGLLAEVCSRLGDVEGAAWLSDEIRPGQGKILMFVGTCACLGPADRLLGLLAATAGRPAEASAFFESALALSRRMGSPVFTAHCLYDYALFLRSTDAARAAEMLAEATETCEHHGFRGLARKITRADARTQ